MTWIAAGFACLLALAGGWLWIESRWDRRLFRSRPDGVTVNVRARKAAALLDSQPGTQVLDVRSAAEFRGGSIPGAVHVPIGDANFDQKAGALDRSRPVLVYCAGGYRSRKAVGILQSLGFREIHHLHRGWLSWKSAGLPAARTVDRQGGAPTGRDDAGPASSAGPDAGRAGRGR
jgi:rhodanese-related sulfurtransferase